MREGFAGIVAAQGDLTMCGASGNPLTAKRQILDKSPDLVTLDISFRSTSGLETIKHIKAHNSKIKILVLSELEEKMHAERVIRAGADGYIMKTASAERVLEAIHKVLDGDIYLSAPLKEEFAKRFVGGETLTRNSIADRLSQREFEVYSLLGRGRSPRDIADELSLSVKTVQAYCTRIKDKLDLENARELLQSAIHWELQSRKELENSLMIS
jgi:DNA-binding NarL/FixJ family response regulator